MVLLGFTSMTGKTGAKLLLFLLTRKRVWCYWAILGEQENTGGSFWRYLSFSVQLASWKLLLLGWFVKHQGCAGGWKEETVATTRWVPQRVPQQGALAFHNSKVSTIFSGGRQGISSVPSHGQHKWEMVQKDFFNLWLVNLPQIRKLAQRRTP